MTGTNTFLKSIYWVAAVMESDTHGGSFIDKIVTVKLTVVSTAKKEGMVHSYTEKSGWPLPLVLLS